MKIWFCLGLSITSHVESFDRFRTVVFEKDNYVIEILNENRTTKNIYIYRYMPLSSLLAWYCMILLYMFISLYLIKKVNDNTQIPQYFYIKGLVICTKINSYVSQMFCQWSFRHKKTQWYIYPKKDIFMLNCNSYGFIVTE